MDKLRLMVVDDHDVVRMGLRALIETQDDFQCVAEASSGPEAVEKAGLRTSSGRRHAGRTADDRP
ncbi:MAG TPA: hypothetical protein VHJ78_04680 [Actinomycetota bacterium]|nr:hypothetical protein [Actinomycetota bacterium]